MGGHDVISHFPDRHRKILINYKRQVATVSATIIAADHRDIQSLEALARPPTACITSTNNERPVHPPTDISLSSTLTSSAIRCILQGFHYGRVPISLSQEITTSHSTSLRVSFNSYVL